MTDQLLESAAGPGDAHRAGRALGIAAVFLGVAALAAATFVLSYPAIHTFALQAGISVKLARFYPGLVDVMLVVILAAVLSLRGAGLPSRLLAWVALVLLLAAAAGASALHADGRRLSMRAAEITAAVLPWLLVLVAFGLLLAMLRHARTRRTWRQRVSPDDVYRIPAGRSGAPAPAAPSALVPTGKQPGAEPPPFPPYGDRDDGLSIIPGLVRPFPAEGASGPASDGPAVQSAPANAIEPGPPAEASERDSDWPFDDSPAADPDGTQDEPAGPALAASGQPSQDADAPTGVVPWARSAGTSELIPEASMVTTVDADDMPVFHRVRSSPTPPPADDPGTDGGNDTG